MLDTVLKAGGIKNKYDIALLQGAFGLMVETCKQIIIIQYEGCGG